MIRLCSADLMVTSHIHWLVLAVSSHSDSCQPCSTRASAGAGLRPSRSPGADIVTLNNLLLHAWNMITK